MIGGTPSLPSGDFTAPRLGAAPSMLSSHVITDLSTSLLNDESDSVTPAESSAMRRGTSVPPKSFSTWLQDHQKTSMVALWESLDATTVEYWLSWHAPPSTCCFGGSGKAVYMGENPVSAIPAGTQVQKEYDQLCEQRRWERISSSTSSSRILPNGGHPYAGGCSNVVSSYSR